ncbi:MAG: hypothetical protein WBP94_02765 [Rhodomicrobiaceae bacterium]
MQKLKRFHGFVLSDGVTFRLQMIDGGGRASAWLQLPLTNCTRRSRSAAPADGLT